jgi:hypothetical protein
MLLLPACLSVLLQLMLVITPDMAVSCAAISPWDDNHLAVAGPHSACSYHLNLSAAAAKGSNLLTLVSHLGVNLRSSWSAAAAAAAAAAVFTDSAAEGAPGGGNNLCSHSLLAKKFLVVIHDG